MTTTPTPELIRALASLKAGRTYSWTAQEIIDLSNFDSSTDNPYELTGNARPINTTDGVLVTDQDGHNAMGFAWRAVLHPEGMFKVTVEVATLHNTSHYFVVLDAGGDDEEICDYTSDGNATATEILGGLKTLIDAAIASHSWPISTDLTNDVLTLQATSGHYGLDGQPVTVSDTVGDGLTLVTTPTTMSYELWVLMGSQTTTDSQWDLWATGTLTENKVQHVDLPGVKRVAVVFSDGDGACTVYVGAPQIEQ